MKKFVIIAATIIFIFQNGFGHVGHMPSVHDTVEGILARMKKQLNADQVRTLDRERVLSFVTQDERKVLSIGFLTFEIDRDADLYLAVDPGSRAPFWLQEEGFEKTDIELVSEGEGNYELWRKSVKKGHVGLGINSIYGGGKHYVVFIKSGTPVKVSHLYPGQHRAVTAKTGEKLYVDRSSTIAQLPTELEGATLIQTLRANRDAGRLIGMLLVTRHPATPAPDQIVLSWENDPRTTQSITWRTDTTVTNALVRYQEKRLVNAFAPAKPIEIAATTSRLVTDDIVNDPVNNRHSVTIAGLKPGTTYLYSVGDASGDHWTELAQFTTAPAEVEPFSFMYLGDAQNGLYRWGSLMKTAYRKRPDVSFVLMAGDLVNRGAQRDDWDDFFYNASQNFVVNPLMAALGNHEYHGGNSRLYHSLLTLPTNGPATIAPEKAYSFEYSNALFVILDSNRDHEKQTPWLENVLKNSSATWKFVMYHHPAYSSSPNRNNPEVLNEWVPIFDKYHVDMALQGHDHAYLRTYPMKNNKPVESTKEGTVYVVSVSGTKMYNQGDFEYTAKGFTNTSTFQILDIQIMGDRLLYKSYDDEGKLVDEIVIEK